MEYIKNTWIYLVIFLTPIIITMIILTVISIQPKYFIISKSIEPYGEKIVTCSVEKGDKVSIETFETYSNLFYNLKRGKISKKQYLILKGVLNDSRRMYKINITNN